VPADVQMGQRQLLAGGPLQKAVRFSQGARGAPVVLLPCGFGMGGTRTRRRRACLFGPCASLTLLLLLGFLFCLVFDVVCLAAAHFGVCGK
jgi:hypothetical protein